jgi:sugar phosphate isomerase/epimerase
LTIPGTIGLSTAALYPAYLTELALDAIASLGFRIVEVFLQCDSEYAPAFGRELDWRRQQSGLTIHSLHLYAPYFDLWSPYVRMRSETRKRFRRVLDTACRLDARAVTWHGLRYGLEEGSLVDAFIDSLGWACKQATPLGITVCIENVSWCYLRTPEHVARLLETGLPIGFTFDTFQAAESGTDPIPLIRAMGDRLVTVHLADYVAWGPRHLPPGQGVLDWPAILGALADEAYQGPLILEPAHVSNHEEFLRARAFVAAILDDRLASR